MYPLEEAYQPAAGVVLGKASRSDNTGVLQVTNGRSTETEVVIGPFDKMAFLAAATGAAALGKLAHPFEVSCYDAGGTIQVVPDGAGAMLTVSDHVAGSITNVFLDADGCRAAAAVAAGLLYDM